MINEFIGEYLFEFEVNGIPQEYYFYLQSDNFDLRSFNNDKDVKVFMTNTSTGERKELTTISNLASLPNNYTRVPNASIYKVRQDFYTPELLAILRNRKYPDRNFRKEAEKL